jgi:5S rRNA maturation endonuclease (ribonuclease M5)
MKIICKFHNDTTPSMHLYGDWGYCFVCHAQVKRSELDLPGNIKEIRAKKNPTNIPETLQYIETLPVQEIRGIKFHFNDRGYFIVWPSKNYYKRRNFDGTDTRYIAPVGVTAPLFVYPGAARHLIIVEGEINAITLHNTVYGEFKICSPGPASNLLRYIKYYLQFSRITIFVDRDAPGVVFGSQLKDVLLKNNINTQLITVEKDFNHVFTEEGEEGVRRLFEESMGMSGTMPQLG